MMYNGRWAVTEAGLYFADSSRRLCRLEASGKLVCLGVIERDGPVTCGIGVSRDGQEVVYVQPEPAHSDLRMAEGRLFR